MSKRISKKISMINNNISSSPSPSPFSCNRMDKLRRRRRRFRRRRRRGGR
jgi:hypothetical protein